MDKKVLVVSASTGNGHNSAGTALVQEFTSRGWQAKMVDAMEHVPDAFRRYYKGGYETLVKRSPGSWGRIYRITDKDTVNFWFLAELDKTFTFQLDKIIKDYRPDWVICTHSVVQPRLAAIRKKLGFKMGIVITDLYPHRMWLRGRPDQFFVPTEATRESLNRRLPYSEKCTEIVGIPVNSSFTKTRDFVRHEDTILLNSGGIGAGPFDEAIEVLLDLGVKLQVVTGRSKPTLDRLKRDFGTHPRLELYGHITPDQMADLMGHATIMIGKSGGLTTFEALATATPFLVVKPFLIPGQEEDNATWLTQIGAGRFIMSVADLPEAVSGLLKHPEQLAAMTAAGKKYGVPDSAKRVGDFIASH